MNDNANLAVARPHVAAIKGFDEGRRTEQSFRDGVRSFRS